MFYHLILFVWSEIGRHSTSCVSAGADAAGRVVARRTTCGCSVVVRGPGGSPHYGRSSITMLCIECSVGVGSRRGIFCCACPWVSLFVVVGCHRPLLSYVVGASGQPGHDMGGTCLEEPCSPVYLAAHWVSVSQLREGFSSHQHFWFTRKPCRSGRSFTHNLRTREHGNAFAPWILRATILA